MQQCCHEPVGTGRPTIFTEKLTVKSTFSDLMLKEFTDLDLD